MKQQTIDRRVMELSIKYEENSTRVRPNQCPKICNWLHKFTSYVCTIDQTDDN